MSSATNSDPKPDDWNLLIGSSDNLPPSRVDRPARDPPLRFGVRRGGRACGGLVSLCLMKDRPGLAIPGVPALRHALALAEHDMPHH